jgi:adenine-specific DNA-methyltransferase
MNMPNLNRAVRTQVEILRQPKTGRVIVTSDAKFFASQQPAYALFNGRCEDLLAALPDKPMFDLVVTSPPYNIGKSYEQKVEFKQYKETHRAVIVEIIKRIKPTGSLCWQVGNHVLSSSNNRGSIYPLDYLFHPMFEELGLVLRD